jgi:hypothetical protein
MKQIDTLTKGKVIAPYAEVVQIEYINEFGSTTGRHLTFDIIQSILNNAYYDKWCISVKPLSSISKEDAIAVAKIEGLLNFEIYPDNNTLYVRDGKMFRQGTKTLSLAREWKNCTIDEETDDEPYNYCCGLSIQSFQYLQSQGYALPYMEYSVDELVDAGIYKLIQ